MKHVGIIFTMTGVILVSCNPSANNASQAASTETADTTTIPIEDSTVYQTANLVIRKISTHCYLHTSYLNTTDFGRVPCNGMVVVNNKEAVVFDTPSDNSTSTQLIRFISDVLGLTIKGIVATHFHEDCVGGLDAFNDKNILSYASDRTIAFLLSGNGKAVNRIQAFKNNLTLEVGDKQVLVRFLGEGHTRDNVIGYFEEDQVVFGGCLIKAVGAGKGNLEDANVDTWAETVRSIKREFPGAKVVVPGHGKVGGPELFDYTIELFRQGNSIETTQE